MNSRASLVSAMTADDPAVADIGQRSPSPWSKDRLAGDFFWPAAAGQRFKFPFLQLKKKFPPLQPGITFRKPADPPTL
jgi:hypothetical protein